MSESVPGSVHDKEGVRQDEGRRPGGCEADGGHGLPRDAVSSPTRKPRVGELTASQKERNRRVSRRRIVAEHGIGQMKVGRIASERYRNPNRRHTLIVKNVAGWHNLRDA